MLVVLVVLWGWCGAKQILVGEVTGSVWAYCNPLVMAEALLIFMIFEKLHFRNQRVIKIINALAKGAFTAYLLHAPLLSFIKIPWAVRSAWYVMIFHILLSVIAIYLTCFICYVIWNKVTVPIFRWISSWKILSHYLC